MDMVGRMGSLISQGVYSVATPFHPFGGAVDIIAVAQQDGTYRSTPWYVCFGKFQGVLKGSEKVVTITVNGVEADFHMYLDNAGTAYFLKEVTSDGEELESSEPCVSGSGRVDSIIDETICSENKGGHENGDFSFGIGDGQSSPGSTSGYGAYQYGSLNEVEDLVESSEVTNSEMVLISVDGHVLTAPISANGENTDSVHLSSTPQFHLGPGDSSAEEFGANGDVWEVDCFNDVDESTQENMNSPRHQLEGLKDGGDIKVHCQEGSDTVGVNVSSSPENVGTHLSKDDLFKSCLDFTVHIDGAVSNEANTLHVEVGRKDESEDPPNDASHHVNNITKDLEISTYHSSTFKPDQVANGVSLCNSDQPSSEILPSKIASGGSVTNDLENGSVPGRSPTVEDCSHVETQMLQGRFSGTGIEISLCGNLIHPGMGRASAEETFNAHRISEMEFKESGQSIIKNGNIIARFQERYFSWDKAAHIIVGKAVFGSHFSVELNDSIPVEHEETPKARGDPNMTSPSYSGRWKLWSIPFRRSRSLQHSNSNSSNEELFVDSESFLQSPKAEQTLNNISQSPRKQYLRTKIPTTEQIASLNLKEGQNKIAFSFSTRVLGKQEVDAHIYLWKWNARIVISDVDGTITKSDVLGQFMPLVGKDWTQSGVAHLFSAIKENGYQLLFLSARAIVQAYLTRSFLLNLKQDGKALPSGPVVISPDGLFPSLYREVIRRAPHEFKIACLEDIRALFPSDYNPFYAGFGNRNTDELSYMKIGIPKGKIFIINPKGEVVINDCIDVKSYTSLHTLVNDMFPPTSLVEQEAFNSWNYWKTPLPKIEC